MLVRTYHCAFDRDLVTMGVSTKVVDGDDAPRGVDASLRSSGLECRVIGESWETVLVSPRFEYMVDVLTAMRAPKPATLEIK